MSKRASAAGVGRGAFGFLAEPYLVFLIFCGIGLGTVLFRQPERLALLWATLAILGLLYHSRSEVDLAFSLTNVERGAALGLVISVPVLAFLARPLAEFNERLYLTDSVVLLFYQVCFVAAPVEEYFFRGILQARKGSSAGLACYAATALLFFLPHAPLLAALLVFVAMGVLGIVYGYVCERYGLAAAISCHVVVGFVLQVAPSLIASMRAMLA